MYPSKSWEEIVPDIGDEERDLISKLVVYESGNRLTADQVCPTWLAVQDTIDANACSRHFDTHISSKCIKCA